MATYMVDIFIGAVLVTLIGVAIYKSGAGKDIANAGAIAYNSIRDRITFKER